MKHLITGQIKHILERLTKHIIKYGAYYLLLALAVIIVYSQTLPYPFIWDDESMVVANPLIKNWQLVPEIFKASAFGEATSAPTFYRPLQILSYLFTYKLFGLEPAAFRLGNIGIHVVSSFLVFHLLSLFGKRSIGFCLALIYAIHPMHIESITYISGRGDSLYLMFCLASIYAYLKSRGRMPGLILAFVCYVFAVLSKENAVLLPLILCAYELGAWFEKRWHGNPVLGLVSKGKARFLTLGLMVFGSAGYGFFRLASVHSDNFGVLSTMAHATFIERLLTQAYIFPTYVRIFFFPFQLHMEYLSVVTSIKDKFFWGWFPLCIFIFIFLVFVSRRLLAVWGFGFAWFVFGMFPTLSILTPMASTVREHWLTFSSLGFFIVFQVWASRSEWVRKWFFASKPVGVLFMLVMCVYLGGAAIYRNFDWRSARALYSHDVALEPRSFVLWNNLGVMYFREGEIKEAVQAFKTSVDVAPGEKGYAAAFNNLGVALEQEGDIVEAERNYLLGIFHSKYRLSFSNLAVLYIKQEKLLSALQVVKQGLTSYPYDYELNYLAAYLTAVNGDIEQALRYLKRVPVTYDRAMNLRKHLSRLP